MTALIYEREASAFKYPYAFDVPLDSWHELVLANALYDQAGFVLLSDVHRPPPSARGSARWPRSTRRRPSTCATGAPGSRSSPPTPTRRRELQASLDWMFILTLEWFGLPDARKNHGIQLEYGFKGKSNDELRQDWMARGRAVHGGGRARGPRPLDEGERYVIDCPFPQRFDSEAKHWGGRRSRWDDVMVRWKGRGPMNETYVAKLQKGYRG